MSEPFAPLVGKPHSIRIGTFDIETWGFTATPDDFALGVVFDGTNFYRFTDPLSMRDFLCSSRFAGTTFFAHNLSGYDGLCLFGDPSIHFGSTQVILKGAKWILAKYKIGKRVIRFGDSVNIFQTSIDHIGRDLGYPKGETPAKFKSGVRGSVTEEDFIYCARDCEILYKALDRLRTTLGEIRITAPSLAIHYFRRNYLRQKFWVKHEIDLKFRPAYYGGRVEAYIIGAVPLNYSYDINSLYPYAMIQTSFPNPETLRQLPTPTLAALSSALDSSEGFATIRLRHLPNRIGYLPYRTKDSVIFPTGTFSGSYAFPEIRYALSTGKVEILSVSEIVIGNRMPSPFTDYVADIYSRKANASGFERECYKLLLNSTYGKFGEYHHKKEFFAPFRDTAILEELEERYGPMEWAPLMDGEAGYFVTTNDSQFDRFSPHTIFSWASYITSMSRVINATYQDTINRLGIRVFYTDTDSFDCDKPLPIWMVGNEIGKLKHLESKSFTIIFGPKDYTLSDAIRRTKGIPRGEANALEDLGGGRYRFKRIVRVKESRRRGLKVGSVLRVTKKLSGRYDKMRMNEKGEALPIILEE